LLIAPEDIAYGQKRMILEQFTLWLLGRLYASQRNVGAWCSEFRTTEQSSTLEAAS
jgi:hypothetical protein